MSDELKANPPEFLTNKVFLKKATLEALGAFINATNELQKRTGEPGNNAILLVSFGIVEGEIAPIPEEGPKPGENIAEYLGYYIYNARNRFLAAKAEKQPVDEVAEASSFILVRNAKIRFHGDWANPLEIPELVLFSDQVIGFCFGRFGLSDQ